MRLRGRADLVRMLAAGTRPDEQFIAELLGYDFIAAPPDIPKPKIKEQPDARDAGESTSTLEPVPTQIDWVELPFFAATAFALYENETVRVPSEPQDERVYTLKDIANRGSARVAVLPDLPPLEPWPRLQRRVAYLLQQSYQSRTPDVDLLMRDISRGQLPAVIPYRKHLRWPRQVSVISDRSRRLWPFLQDQNRLISRLKRLLGQDNVHEYLVDDEVQTPLPMRTTRRRRRSGITSERIPVLALSDCGGLTEFAPLLTQWQRLAGTFYANSIPFSALLPAPAACLPAALRQVAKLALWEETKLTVQKRTLGERQEQARRLLSMLSAASRVEPGLLRAVRRLLPPGEADIATESDVWMLDEVASRAPKALTISTDEEPQERLKDLRAQTDLQLRLQVAQLIFDWHGPLRKEVWYEELHRLTPEEQQFFPPEILQAAEEDLKTLARTIIFPDESIGEKYLMALHAWLLRFYRRTGANATIWKNAGELSRLLQQALTVVQLYQQVAPTPAGYDPRFDGEPGDERCWTVRQAGGELQVVEETAGSQAIHDSIITVLRSTRPRLHCVRPTESGAEEQGYWTTLNLNPATGEKQQEWVGKPAWADAFGRDDYGIWAQFTYKGVQQRLRWIEPGTFLMGSPEDEAERSGDEQQHPVTLTAGYWLFDTPVTQALWEEVMGENPSNFKGDERPVEQVSWDDSKQFIDKINSAVAGLQLALPTEAQWEYACRAGTSTPFYTGENLTTDQANYDGNNPYAGNPKGKYRAETTPVGSFSPNPWGLYDMHGNVWEWCEDFWQKDLGKEAVTDPAGPEMGTYRVSRGGGWSYDARLVRSASRDHDTPGFRFSYRGFRCARVQDSAAAEQGGTGERSREGRKANRAGEAAAKNVLFRADGTKYSIEPGQPGRIGIGSGNLQLQTDQGKLTISTLTKPEWAEAIGRDQYGLWAGFSYKDVAQRLRWIPPGQFMMGSPEDEPERIKEREKQHLVTLTRGFWLFDTTVTQELWEAVRGENPSRFKGSKRPVERVSWDDSKQFIDKINSAVAGLQLTLPTEAQWEYACRAGTTTPFYTGENLTTEQANYDGNNPYAGNPKGKYRKETTPVGSFAPNPWGLYDMHGNVWEWCRDYWQEDLGSADMTDPSGPEHGTGRVIRGGGWGSLARRVRSAYRDHYTPGSRYYFRGFRCARVQEA